MSPNGNDPERLMKKRLLHEVSFLIFSDICFACSGFLNIGLFQSLDREQVAVNSQSAVSIVSEHLLCKNLAQLYTFLVEAVQIPYKALEHDLVFKVRKQSAKGTRRQLLADNDTGRTSAFKPLIQICIVFATGKCDDLRGNVCTEFLLACAALDINVTANLGLSESDELHRNDICALVE